MLASLRRPIWSKVGDIVGIVLVRLLIRFRETLRTETCVQVRCKHIDRPPAWSEPSAVIQAHQINVLLLVRTQMRHREDQLSGTPLHRAARDVRDEVHLPFAIPDPVCPPVEHNLLVGQCLSNPHAFVAIGQNVAVLCPLARVVEEALLVRVVVPRDALVEGCCLFQLRQFRRARLEGDKEGLEALRHFVSLQLVLRQSPRRQIP